MTVHLIDHDTGLPLVVPMTTARFAPWWEQNKHLYIHMITVTQDDEMKVLVRDEPLTLEKQL